MRVFISYSWDSDSHKEWVRYFADVLLASGVDVTLDQYDLSLGHDRFEFMDSAVRDADCILCICTPDYVRKANKRQRGVGVETVLITPQFFERVKGKWFIPVIRRTDEETPATPDYMLSLVFVDFRNDVEFATRMEELLRHLHDRPIHRKPPIGPIPNFDVLLGKNALIIEDSISFGQALAQHLEGLGCKAVFTYSPGPALELARRYPPDIVIMDTYYVRGEDSFESAPGDRLLVELRKIAPRAVLIGLKPFEHAEHITEGFDHVILRTDLAVPELVNVVITLCLGR